MSRTHLFNVNRSVTSLANESRQLRLPTMRSFPKLGHKISRSAVIDGAAVALPEMTGDVIDVAAGYAVENVKRDRTQVRSVVGMNLRHLVGRMLGMSHRAARP